jgi:hypothetical protein
MLIELVETYEVNQESGRNRLVGWHTVDVAGMDEAEMKEIDARRDKFLPPLLREALADRGERYVLQLPRSGTMTRFFIRDKNG